MATSDVDVPPPNPNWRDWADISKSMAAQIAGHALANDVADYLNFRAAYAPWRDSTEDPKKHSVLDQRFHPRRWILLPKESDADDDSRSWRRMLNLSHGRKITVELPHLLGHAVAAGSGGSPGGVLVLIHEETLVVRLLNPLTGQRVDLPSIASVLSRRRNGRLDTAFSGLCNVTGAGFAGDSTVVLHFGYDNKLVYAKIGGDSWEIVSEASLLCSTFPFYGKVYFANGDGLMLVDTDAALPKLVLAAKWPQQVEITVVHMADSSGELMVLTNKARFRNGSDDYMVEFEIFRLDADAGVLVPVTGLGERAVFVGDYCGGLVVSAKGIVPNAIYFQHDRYSVFYVRCVSDDETRLLTEAEKGSFIDNLTSYVAWNGRKTGTQVALAVREEASISL
ncbi:unnamed protein product [Alopecurus aequalis]